MAGIVHLDGMFAGFSPPSCSRWMQCSHREQIVPGFGPSFCSDLKENRMVVSRTGGLWEGEKGLEFPEAAQSASCKGPFIGDFRSVLEDFGQRNSLCQTSHGLLRASAHQNCLYSVGS